MATAAFGSPSVRTIRGTDVHRMKADHRGLVMILKDTGALILAPEVLRVGYHAYELYVSHPGEQRGRIEARVMQYRIPLSLDGAPPPPPPAELGRLARAAAFVREWWVVGLCLTAVVAFWVWAVTAAVQGIVRMWGFR